MDAFIKVGTADSYLQNVAAIRFNLYIPAILCLYFDHTFARSNIKPVDIWPFLDVSFMNCCGNVKYLIKAERQFLSRTLLSWSLYPIQFLLYLENNTAKDDDKDRQSSYDGTLLMYFVI
jgi:hypothetical protein